MVKEEKDASGLGWKKTILKDAEDWKNTILKDAEEAVGRGSGSGSTPKKRRLAPLPEHFFLPRSPLSHNILFYGACIAGGIGAGMIVEVWMNKKIKGIYTFCIYICICSHPLELLIILNRVSHV